MKQIVMCWVIFLCSVNLQAAAVQASTCVNSDAKVSDTGFLVVAPDRGFAGNETVREAFLALPKNCNAELVFVTDSRARPYIKRAVQALVAAGANELTVLPLFFSTAHPRYERFQQLLKSVLGPNLSAQYSRAFGDSYLAVEMLTQRLQAIYRDVETRDSDKLILAGYGAEDASSTSAMAADLNRIASWVALDSDLHSIKTVIWPGSGTPQAENLNDAAWLEVANTLTVGATTTILPFHMGMRLDSMMSFDAWLADRRPENTRFLSTSNDERQFFALWMHREINRCLFAKGRTGKLPGVIFLAHGADFHWNQTMRESVQELSGKYPLEFAFSMADPPSIRKAVKRLELQGVPAIVIVRVFGMPDSFRTAVERLTGQEVEALGQAPEHSSHQGHHTTAEPVARLLTTTLVTTTGGLGDHPLFAQALLEKVMAVSHNPGQETIILTAHGKGTEPANKRWMKVLESLAKQMQVISGGKFRGIRFQTWREDWPDEREQRVSSVRSMVQTALEDSGRPIVVAARTTGTGPADDFLEGLEYQLVSGFAPHPLFSQWVELQIEVGVSQLRDSESYFSQNSLVSTSNRLN